MRFFAAATLMAFATTVISDPWRPLGGDMAYVGPSYNATFKAGDTIPLEYTFYSIKMVNRNSTTNSTITGLATLTSLMWSSGVENKTLEVAFNNNRADENVATCLPTDICQGSYHPKRVNLVIPGEAAPSSNYSLTLGYTLSIAGSKTIYYKTPVNVVASSVNITSPPAVFGSTTPSVQVILPVIAVPKNSALSSHVPKAFMAMVVLLASALTLF
ncbi:hypothetical protein KVV02_004980 [Mortierella alpina]|uniref:Uncharacterized protein n=1 Tax=Mortierella alpina TaxID=64518 RepID=A0A9P7ZXD9_MORAP|nr:hypothetical protein KVV02_004980 [Mortierella alpina]